MNRPRAQHGFTLVELIVVMSMLTAVLALAAPQLSNFFKGRALVEESRRFLALTRYARDESITLSIPLKLWIDVERGYYGLSPAEGFEFDTMREVEIQLDEDLEFDFISGVDYEDKIITIGFYPDGTVGERTVGETTLRSNSGIENDIISLILRAGENDWLVITQDEYGQRFIVLTQDEYLELERRNR